MATMTAPRRRVISLAAFGAAVLLAAGLLSGCSDESGAPSFLRKSGGGSGSSSQSFFNPSVDDIVMDEETGLEVVKDVISIHFSPKLDEASIKKIISSVNGEIVGYDKAVNLYQVRFPGKSLEDIDKIRIKLLSEHKEIEMASRLPVSAHKNPYYVK